MRIAVSGPPGSGKTTVCVVVAEKMGYELVLVGRIFRDMADERGVDLAAFGRLAEEDDAIDRELDRRMVAIARAKEDIVVEGRLTAALLKREGVDVLAVGIGASEAVRCERIAGRECKPQDDVLEEMRVRERSEAKRYGSYYGIDPTDRSIYDIWIDSSERSPEDIADEIVQKARRRCSDEAAEG
jgi:predicted cytidylate kinase